MDVLSRRPVKYSAYLLGCVLIALFVVLGNQLQAIGSTTAAIKLAPTSIALQEPSAGATGLNNLLDRDTLSEYSASEQSSLIVKLDKPTPIHFIKVFSAAPYRLTAEAWDGVQWQSIAGLEKLNLSSLQDTWYSYEADAPVTTEQLRLTLSPQAGGSATGLKELEIWGQGERLTYNTGVNLRAMFDGDEPKPASVFLYASNLNEGVIGQTGASGDDAADNTFVVTLPQRSSEIKRAWLSYETHGAGHWVSVTRNINQAGQMGGDYRFASTAWNRQLEALNPQWLVTGENRISFSVAEGQSYRIRQLHLMVELENGSNFVGEIQAYPNSDTNSALNLHDGDTDTGWRPYPSTEYLEANPNITYLFDKGTELDRLDLYLTNKLEGKIETEFLENGEWKNAGVNAIVGSGLQTGWNPLDIQSATAIDGVRLSFINAKGSSADIKALVPVGSGVGLSQWPARIDVSYPDNGQYYGANAYLRGMVTPVDNGSGPAKLFAGSREISREDGAIEALVNQSEFVSDGDGNRYVELSAVYPDDERITRKIYLGEQYDATTASAKLKTYNGKKGLKSQENSNPGQAVSNNTGWYRIEHDEGVLELEYTSMKEHPSTLSMGSLEVDTLPALDPGMTNVTKGPRRGYRFGPHGKKFKKNIRVMLPYDKNRLPGGMTEDDIKTYYFDDEVGHWVALERVKVEKDKRIVLSHTDHFTDMINATVTVPESPQAASFNPTQIKDIKAADPGTGINLIEPPKASNMGDANLSYPIEIPAGRNGMQPQLAISYNSGGGNSWLGQGWDLSVPSISVDTRWGVPRYGYRNDLYEEIETETYLLNGQQLTPMAHRGALMPRVTDRDDFHTRVEGGFQKIIRHGDHPTKYWWEVIDKNGTRNFYGGVDDDDTNGILGGGKGIFKWMLRQTIDTNGNTVTYNYDFDAHPGIATGTVPGAQLYLKSINYTGHGGVGNGAYDVIFTRDTEIGEPVRPDVTIDARGGFKQVSAALLRKIEVKYNENTLVRHYALNYEEGAFKKSLLMNVIQYDSESEEFNEHTFNYYDDIRTGVDSYSGFQPAINGVDTGESITASILGESAKYTVLGGSKGTTTGFNSFGGVGVSVGTKNLNVGMSNNMGESNSKGEGTFVDVNGDGLPDKVFKMGGATYYRANTTSVGALNSISFDSGAPKYIPGFTRPAESESVSTGMGVQVAVIGITGNAETGSNNTTEKTYLSDVNGDGLVDIVDNGRVLFNQARNSGVAAFSDDSSGTYFPIGNIGGSVISAVLPNMDQALSVMEEENPLMDNVRRWIAPYDGTVRIVSGNIQLIDFSDKTAFTNDEVTTREEYKYADGVRLAIQKSGSELWFKRIDADDHKEYSPKIISNIQVEKGDAIYFRVQSVFDGAYDVVKWSPKIEYIGTTQPNLTDVNDLNVYRYQASDDFTYANRPLEMTAPYRGKMIFSGILNKTSITTDDITVRVTKIMRELNSQGGLISQEEEVVFSKKLAWNDEGVFDLNKEFNVGRYDGINVDLVVDSPIDLTKLEWGGLGQSDTDLGKPTLHYTEAWQEEETPLRLPEETVVPDKENMPTNGNDIKPEPGDTSGLTPILDANNNPIVIPEMSLKVFDEDTNEPLIVMPVMHDMDIYPGNHLTNPQKPWIATKDGVVFMTPWVSLKTYSTVDDSGDTHISTKVRDGSVFVTVKRRNELVAKHEVVIENGQIINPQGYDALKVFKVQKGDELFYDVSIRPKTLKIEDKERFDNGELNFKLEEEIDSSVVKINYASNTAWKVPVSDEVDFLTKIRASVNNFAANESYEYDQRAMLVVRRGDDEVVHSKILDFSGINPGIIANGEMISSNFIQPIVDGEEWYFDVFTVEPRLTFNRSQQTVQTRYKSNDEWVAPFTGDVGVLPLLNFKDGNVPDGSFRLEVMVNGARLAFGNYQVNDGKVVDAQVINVPVTIAAGQVLTFSYWTGSHKMSSYLSDKGSVSIDYINHSTWDVPVSIPSEHLDVNPDLKLTGSSIADGSVMLRVSRDNTDLATRQFTITDGVVVEKYDSPLSIAASPGDALVFAFETDQLSVAQAMQGSKISVSGITNNATRNINLLNQRVGSKYFYIDMPRLFEHQIDEDAVQHFPVEDYLWGESFRGWGTAAYNGNGSAASSPINERLFIFRTDEAAYQDRNTVHHAWISYPDIKNNRWNSQDNRWWTTAEQQSSSRKGRDYFYVPSADEFTVVRSGGRSPASRPPKMSETDISNFGGGFVLTGNSSDNNTTNLLDVMDVNGDRFPDIIGQGGTQYTWADGTLFDFNAGSGAARTTHEAAETFGFGVGGSGSTVDGEGEKSSGGDKSVADIVSIPISASLTKGSNNSTSDLIDINGDGLPDRVSPGPGGLLVALNTGYGFEPGELWLAGALNNGVSETNNVGVGFGMWNGTFSGGVSLSEGHNYGETTLMDINGDGMPDVVRKHQTGKLHVLLNTGSGFYGPIYWPGAVQAFNDLQNGASSSVGSLTPVSDGASASASQNIGFGFGFNVFFVNFSFNFGASSAETISLPSIAYMDVNGDGFVDGVRTADASRMDVSLNPIRRTNMLKSVNRPLGSTFELEYTRVGNTFDYPQSKYVMNKVKVFDGTANDTPTADSALGSDFRVFEYDYDGAKYDRYEREFLGFTKVVQKAMDTQGLHAAEGQVSPLDANRSALDSTDSVYRKVEEIYSTASIYTRGLKLQSKTLSANDALYQQTDNRYVLRRLAVNGQSEADFVLKANDRVDPPTVLLALSNSAATVFPYVATTTQSSFEGGTSSISTTTEYEYDAYGNVSHFTDRANAGDTTDDVFATITYSHEDAACAADNKYIVGKATSIEVSKVINGPWQRKRVAGFDCSTGNLDWLEQYNEGLDGPSTARTDINEYDSYGNIVEIKGAANYKSERLTLRYTYDTDTHTYPVNVENSSYGISSRSIYDPRFGQPLCTTDTNGNSMGYVYDAKGRNTKIVGPYELPDAWQCSRESALALADSDAYTIAFDYQPYANLSDGSGNPTPRTINSALTKHYDRDVDHNPKADPIETVLFTDGLKQVLQTKKDASLYTGVGQNAQPAMIISGWASLDAFGRAVKQYYPTQHAKGSQDLDFIRTVDSVTPTVTDYDVMDRSTSVTLPDGTATTMAYAIDGGRFVTTTTDSRGNSKTSYRDVRELITKVVEEGGITTAYEYDFLKQITQVKDADNNLTDVKYDKRGRRISINNLDTGETKMWHDPAGNLVKKQTANLARNGQYITYDYDYGRLTDIHYPNFAANDVHYIYGKGDSDKAHNQVGRIKALSHQSGSEIREYGKLGETTREVKTLTIAAPGNGGPVPTFETLYDFDTFGRLMRIVLPDGETLDHHYDTGGSVTRISGRNDGADYDYLSALHYDKFGQRRYMALGNGVKSVYRYDEKTRRLCHLQSGTAVDASTTCDSNLPQENAGNEASAALKALVTEQRNQGSYNRFQSLHYAYDKVGNILGTANAVRLPPNRDLGGPVWQGFKYDKLYRLTEAEGEFETRAGQFDSYNLSMSYNNIHNITHKKQDHILKSQGDKTRIMRDTTYDWGYSYKDNGHTQPHAPTHIGDRTFNYDANGNQLGWTHDKNGTRRNITWDDENRIQKIGDPSNTLEFGYDDAGERVLKRGQHGSSVYVNQYFTVRNQALASKHVFAGTTRIATKVEPGAPVGYRTEPLSIASTVPAETGILATVEQAATEAVAQVKTFFGMEGHPGQGLEHRSERANQVARNTEKNKHLNGGVPGGEHGKANSNKGGNGNNAGNNAGKGNNGNGGTGGNGNTGGGTTGGGNTKAPYDYGGSFLYYYHADHLGSSSYITDSNAKLYEHIQYIPFGETWVQEAANTLQRVPYRFTGKELDEETGLYYYGARYYDPRTSVWVSADPILEKYLSVPTLSGKKLEGRGIYQPINMALYSYSYQRPVILSDPNGERPLTPGEVVLAQSVFGGSINYSKVDIYSNSMSSSDSLALGFANSILIASDIYKADMSKSGTYDRGNFIHEMAHIWQSQKGMFTTLRGAAMHIGATIKGFFKGLFSNKSISQSIKDERKDLYNIMSGKAKPLGEYGMEQQAKAIERNYTGNEQQKAGNSLKSEEMKASQIMGKTPSFPTKEALD